MFRCEVCGEIFPNLVDIEFHIDTYHEDQLEKYAISRSIYNPSLREGDINGKEN